MGKDKERKRRKLAAIALIVVLASLLWCIVALILAPTISEDVLPADILRPETGKLTQLSSPRLTGPLFWKSGG